LHQLLDVAIGLNGGGSEPLPQPNEDTTARARGNSEVRMGPDYKILVARSTDRPASRTGSAALHRAASATAFARRVKAFALQLGFTWLDRIWDSLFVVSTVL
jgi:hypothetical protein